MYDASKLSLLIATVRITPELLASGAPKTSPTEDRFSLMAVPF